MISYIDFDNFRRSFEIPRSRRLVTVGERLSDDKSYIRDTIIKACWGTPWRTRRWTGSGTVKRRCRSLTTGAVSLQLGRRRLGQKNRVDEKVFVECNIQKESKVKSEKSKVKSQKSKVKSEKWNWLRYLVLPGGSWRMWVPVYVSTIFIFLFVDYDFLTMIVLYQSLVLDLSLYIFKQRTSMIDFVTRLSITTSF